MDPASILVVLLAAWAIAQRTPGIVGQAAAEWKAGRSGETTEAAEAVRSRLTDAGVDPASTGGPLRDFLGNLWRDYWHDKDDERQQRRADEQAAGEQNWWQRKVGAALDRQASKYRGSGEPETMTGDLDPQLEPSSDTGSRPAGPSPAGDQTDPPAEPNPAPGPRVATETPTDDTPGVHIGEDRREPIRVPSTLGPEPRPAPTGFEGAGRTPVLDVPLTAPEIDPPIRVPSTLGEQPQRSPAEVAVLDPPAQQHQLEGNHPMGTAVATNGVAITTMTSGAYEMGSIDARLHAAVNEFVVQLTQLQNRLVRAGESTLSTVQLSSRSTVMGSMSQSVEAISALKAAARGCAGEVSPLVQATRREFEKRI